MWLRYSPNVRPIIAILAATMTVVALACGGEAATPTSQATLPSPTATSPADTDGATATPVPDTVMADRRGNFVDFLLTRTGYQEKWDTPVYGGIYKAGLPNIPSRFSGYNGYGSFYNWQFSPHNSLLQFDPWLEQSDGVFCDLCTSWSINEDGTKYTFELHEGVKFHSEGWGKDLGAPGFGDEIVCEDVKASMERYARPHESATPGTKATAKKKMSHLNNVTCPDGPDGYTAVLNFSHFRNPTTGWLASGFRIWEKNYLAWLDNKYLGYIGIQNTAKEEGWLSHMGTGHQIPTFANAEVVVKTKTKTNPNYWVKGSPFVDGFEWHIIEDYYAKFAAFITGRIHHAGHGSSGLTKAQAAQLVRDYPDYDRWITQYNHIQWMNMNPTIPPFDSWKVRWAVMLVLDRSSWNEFIMAGTIDMAPPSYWMHPASPWAIPEEEFLTFPGWRQDKKDEDIAEANRLLDEVFGEGVRPRIKFPLITSGLVSRREISVWGAHYFPEALGWEFELKAMPYRESSRRLSSCISTLAVQASPPHNMSYIPDPSDAYMRALSGPEFGNSAC